MAIAMPVALCEIWITKYIHHAGFGSARHLESSALAATGTCWWHATEDWNCCWFRNYDRTLVKEWILIRPRQNERAIVDLELWLPIKLLFCWLLAIHKRHDGLSKSGIKTAEKLFLYLYRILQNDGKNMRFLPITIDPYFVVWNCSINWHVTLESFLIISNAY